MRIVKYVAPLVNLVCEDHNIDLSGTCRIRRLSSAEIDLLREFRKALNYAIDIAEFGLEVDTYTSVMEGQNEWSEEESRLLGDAKRAALRGATILRLCKEEKIGFNVLMQVRTYTEGPRQMYTWGHFKFWGRLDKYAITADESDAFRAFYREIDRCKFDAAQVAVDWFNKTYIEAYVPRDVLLDAMIALESLYMPDRDELRYRLATRMAALLALPQDRKDVFANVRQAYDLRSNIVHGGTIDDETEKKINEVLPRIMGYLRESLILFLRNPDVKGKLDDIVLGVAKSPNTGFSSRNAARATAKGE